MARPWPAACAICGMPVRKAESHAGAPGSPQPVRHLDCALSDYRRYNHRPVLLTDGRLECHLFDERGDDIGICPDSEQASA